MQIDHSSFWTMTWSLRSQGVAWRGLAGNSGGGGGGGQARGSSRAGQTPDSVARLRRPGRRRAPPRPASCGPAVLATHAATLSARSYTLHEANDHRARRHAAVGWHRPRRPRPAQFDLRNARGGRRGSRASRPAPVRHCCAAGNFKSKSLTSERLLLGLPGPYSQPRAHSDPVRGEAGREFGGVVAWAARGSLAR